MKRMVCEMCESTNFIRTATGYTCKDCGMEYSAEIAKTLLKEIDTVVINDDKVEVNEVSSVNESMNDSDLIRLKSELLVWYTFFEKCNEVEKDFYVDIEKSNGSTMHLLDRNIQFDVDQLKKKAHGKITTRCVDEFYKIQNLKNDYKSYIRKCETAKTIEKDIDSYIKKERLAWFFMWFGIGALLTVIFSMVGVPVLIFSIVKRRKYKKELEVLFQEKAEHGIKNDEELQELSFYDWMFKNYINGNQKNEYTSKILNYYKKYDIKLVESIESYKDTIIELKNIREEIIKKVSLPEKYRNEESVKGLLSLVLDGRATSLKEAINLYEEEKFRSSMLQSINNLSAKIDGLANIMVKGFSVVIDSNLMMCEQLNAIKTYNEALVLDAIWDI